MDTRKIAEIVDCAGFPYNMEDEGHRLRLIKWKEQLEDMVAMLDWIAKDANLTVPETMRQRVERLMRFESNAGPIEEQHIQSCECSLCKPAIRWQQ